MKIVTIQPNKCASKRTKERVKEHGPSFELVERRETVQCLGGESGFLIRTKTWFGWVPEVEVILIDSK